jgi:hypothetical protein
MEDVSVDISASYKEREGVDRFITDQIAQQAPRSYRPSNRATFWWHHSDHTTLICRPGLEGAFGNLESATAYSIHNLCSKE